MNSVNVLMSTYNGEKYLKEQVRSIFSQQNAKIFLTVRDDGTTDTTLQVLEELQDAHKGEIVVIKAKNVGYRRSFLQLLKFAEKTDYYAFADQDDVWQPEKCIRAIERIKTLNAEISLYASSLTIVDSQLNELSHKSICNMPNTIESYFTRARLAGCTYLFTANLKELVEQFSDLALPQDTMPDHDFVVAACAFACEKVYLDGESYILHRRHQRSVTSGGNGILKRLKVEYANIFKRKNEASTMASLLLDGCKSKISPENQRFLFQAANYKKKVKYWIGLLCNPKMTANLWICNCENRLKLMLRRY